MKPHIRLLAIDIDGTLLDPQYQISARNLTALERAHRAGIEVALVTGRRHRFALPVAQSLGFDVCLISSNGAVTKSSRGELFHRDLLPLSTARKLCAYMDEFHANTVLTFDIETKGALVLEPQHDLASSVFGWLEKNAPYMDFVQPLEKALVSDPVQIMFCGALKRMEQAQNRLACSELMREITVLRTVYPPRNLSILDVLTHSCSKGHALERWAKHRGIRREEVMAIGDNYNDVEMLEFAGMPVIMGNAAEQLKQNGWAVTLGNDESGVAVAVERLLGETFISA
ncbi:MAG TPA: Cof-type HAD-IIB family hydrolase [Candidatus Angelobacter sp.]